MSFLANVAALGLAPLVALSGDGGRLVVEPLPAPAGPQSVFPDFAAGSDGSPLLCWIERGEERTSALACARLEGAGWSAPRTIAQGEDWLVNWADFPTLAALDERTLAAVWLVRGASTGHGYGARFTLSRDGGASWSAPRALHDDASDVEHGFVSLAPDAAAGAFRAIWLDGRALASGGDATALYTRSVSPDGALGAERVLDERVCDCCQTALAALGGGSFALAWRDRAADERRDVTLGYFATDELLDAARDSHDGWITNACPVNGPALAVRGTDLALAWFTEAGGRPRVRVARGAWPALGAPKDVDDGRPLGRVDLVHLADGRLLVLWLEARDAGAEWRVRLLGPAAEPGPATTVARVASSRAAGFARLAAHADGAVAAWTDPEHGVQAARIAWRGE